MIPAEVLSVLEQRVSYHVLAPFLERAKHPLIIMEKSGFKYCFNYYIYGACDCVGRKLTHVSQQQVAIIRASGATYKQLQSWAREHYNHQECVRKKNEQRQEQQRVEVLKRAKEAALAKSIQEEKLRVEAVKRAEEEALAKVVRQEKLRMEEVKRAEEVALRLERDKTFLKNEPRRLFAQSPTMYDVARVCIHQGNETPWFYDDCFAKIRFAKGSQRGSSRRRWICKACFPTVVRLSPNLFDPDTLFSKTYLAHITPKLTRKWVRLHDKFGRPQRCHKGCFDDDHCYLEWAEVETNENEQRSMEHKIVDDILNILKDPQTVRAHVKELLYMECLLPTELCALVLDY